MMPSVNFPAVRLTAVSVPPGLARRSMIQTSARPSSSSRASCTVAAVEAPKLSHLM